MTVIPWTNVARQSQSLVLDGQVVFLSVRWSTLTGVWSFSARWPAGGVPTESRTGRTAIVIERHIGSGIVLLGGAAELAGFRGDFAAIGEASPRDRRAWVTGLAFIYLAESDLVTNRAAEPPS